MFDDLTPHVHCPHCDATYHWLQLIGGGDMQGDYICDKCGQEFHWDAEIIITATKEV